MKWTSAAAYSSGAAILAALLSQALDWRIARAWFVLAWAILLLFVVVGLFGHPMRWPAWGLFVGFWAAVGAIWLIVVQALATADVLRQPEYAAWAAWPLAVLGLWMMLASGLGFGNGVFPRVVDALGILTGAVLFAISVATWVSAPNLARLAAGVAAVLYSLWVLCIGQVFWRSTWESPVKPVTEISPG